MILWEGGRGANGCSFFGKQDGSFVLEVAEIGTYAGDESQMFGGCNVV